MDRRMIVKMLGLGALALPPLDAQKGYAIDGPMELHIWLTAKPGQEEAIEKTFREVFYPAVSSRKGFRSALMMRKPGTADYTVRLSFDTEELRAEWVASEEHQKAWPALQSLTTKAGADGFAVIYPK
jgi:heme-degrading monooxygenase HmoA